MGYDTAEAIERAWRTRPLSGIVRNERLEWSMGNRIVSRLVILAMGWIAAASLTWFFCPPPNPPFSHPDAPDSSARIVYSIYCLGFWPVIAYQALIEKR